MTTAGAGIDPSDRPEILIPAARQPMPEAGASLSLSRKILRSVIFGGLRYLLIAPVPLLMTPLILKKIGVLGYGTWAVFLAINSLTSLADLGLVGTLSKHVAEYHARRDWGAMDKLLNSGLAVFLLLDLAIVILLTLLAPLLVARLFQSAAESASLIHLLRCFSVVIAANILTQLFASITTGLQRLDLSHLVSTVNVLLGALFGALLLLAGWGLSGLVYGSMASAVIAVGAYIVVIARLMPEFRANCLRFDACEARKMLGYSLRLYVTQAAVIVHNQIEKVFLAVLVGVPPVGWFEIASDLAVKIRGGIGFVLGPVLPAASGLHALADRARMRELYYRSHKYLAAWGIPVVCYVLVVASRFVVLWLGPGLALVAGPMKALLIANFINLTTGPGFLIFAGSGNLKPGMQAAVMGLIANVLLSFGLIYRYGFAGAVMGTSVALVLASGYFLVLFHRRTGYSILRLLRESYAKPLVVSIALLTALFTMCPPANLSWLGLGAMGVVFAILYCAGILLCHFLDEYDWKQLESFLPVARRARRVLRLA